MKLISFKQRFKDLIKDLDNGKSSFTSVTVLSEKYINFIEQKLKLEMFIACVDGKPVEEPIGKDKWKYNQREQY